MSKQRDLLRSISRNNMSERAGCRCKNACARLRTRSHARPPGGVHRPLEQPCSSSDTFPNPDAQPTREHAQVVETALKVREISIITIGRKRVKSASAESADRSRPRDLEPQHAERRGVRGSTPSWKVQRNHVPAAGLYQGSSELRKKKC